MTPIFTLSGLAEALVNLGRRKAIRDIPPDAGPPQPAIAADQVSTADADRAMDIDNHYDFCRKCDSK